MLILKGFSGTLFAWAGCYNLLQLNALQVTGKAYDVPMLNDKEIKMLAWIGTVCGIIGSLLVATNNGLQFVGYISFLIGAVSCVIVSIKRKDKAGFTLWAFFTIVNLWGIVNYA